MAHGKVSLPQDLRPDALFSSKDEALKGNEEEKGLMGSLDVSKDQILSETNIIPLSPQWLHAKSVDAKPLASGTSGEVLAPGSFARDSSIDSNPKDVWRSDGSRDRKDWRKNAPDLDVNRRWREEERETGLLGRRDRKKEDRRAGTSSTRDVTDNRAEDHRVGGTSIRDVSENKVLSSDRWHESRRDNKWSSRWGPEDKDKESRAEKTDAEREDPHVDKQTLVSSNRAVPERDSDSRDKWRPRHRMEVQSGGPASYRAAPGFGMARGQVEKVGFASGRGRSNTDGSRQIGRPSSGSVLDPNRRLFGKAGRLRNMYCYPRGKLLDIYRKQKIESTLNIMPDGIEHVSPITQVGLLEPLAFVAPDAEEEACMDDIWKGRCITSEELYSSSRDKSVLNNDTKGICNATKEEQQISVKTEQNTQSTRNTFLNNNFPANGAEAPSICGSQTHMLSDLIAPEGDQKVLTPTAAAIADGLPPVVSKNHDCEISRYIGGPGSDLSELESSGFQEKTSSCGDHNVKGNKNADLLERVASPEDFNLYYLDPEGNTQGPFLGIDIISWFNQGFFGTELPVRLVDAPDGSPFHELGEVMPHLKTESGLVSNTNLPTELETLGGVGSSFEEQISVRDYEESTIRNNQHWTSSGFDATSIDNVQSRKHGNDNKFEEDEEIVFPGRPKSSSDFPLRRHSADIQGTFSTSPSFPSLANDVSESNLPNRQDDNLHPFGLLMSELRGSSHLRPAQSSNVSLGMDDQVQFRDTLFEGGISKLNWSNNPNILPPAHQTVPDMDLLIELQRQEQQQRMLEIQHQRQLELQQQHHHQLEFQQKQRQLELQQQRQLEFQQQLQLELQLQRELELQQQRELELQQQRQLELQQLRQLELQHQRQLELQQLQRQEQQRQLEFQQLQRQLELQQQQRQLEHQPQHHLQQQLHHYQMKLQQQQLSQAEHLFLEQLLNQQMSDSGYGQRKLDAARDNFFDQLHSSNRLPNDLHHDTSLEQIIQATMGQGALQGQTDFFDLISQAKQGNMNTSEPPLRLNEEELHAHQLSLALREQRHIEGDRRIGGQWFAGELGPFVRDPAARHQAHLLGLNSSENYQQQQRFSTNEQHHNWNHVSRDIPQGGVFEPGSLEFDGFSLPTGSHGMNLDIANTRGQGSDVREQYRLNSSFEERGSLSSGISSHGAIIADELYSSHPNAFESLPGGNNDADLNIWGSTNDDKGHSKQSLLDLHQKFGQQPIQSSEDYQHHLSSSRCRGSSTHLPFNILPDQSVGLNNSLMQDHLGSFGMNEQPSNMARNSDSRTFMEAQLFSGTRDACSMAEQQETVVDSRELTINSHSRHSSLGSAGGYGAFHNSEMGLDKSLREDVSGGRPSSTATKGFDSALQRRRVLSSQDVLSEAAVTLPVKPRSSISLRSSEGNTTAARVSESLASSKNDSRFRRTSSYSDAGVSETSFIDVLKKPVIQDVDVANRVGMESSDGGGQLGGKTGKKKGKKGRQIDPALLGFKVSSKGSGEIHGFDY